MGTLWYLQHCLAALCLSVTSTSGGEQRDPPPALTSIPAVPCPPGQQCGCWHKGRHYPVGSEFWTDETCSSRCTCLSQGDPPQCSSATCPENSFCGVENGTPGCYQATEGICRIHGDPHYYTFDKASYHFMGNCTYVLAQRCNKQMPVPYFKVEAKNVFLEEPPQTYVHRVLTHVYGHHVEIHKDVSDQVMVDKIWRTLPVSYADGSVTVTKSGRYISLETEFQLRVSYDTDHLVEIRLPALFSSMTCGMCGNFNGNMHDDLMMPDGRQAQGANELGDSWRVIDAEQGPLCGVPDVEEPCTPDQEDLYETDEFCGILTSSPGPFQACHLAISPQSFLYSCVRDMCSFQGRQERLCQTLSVYSDACQRTGLVLPDWRPGTFCPFLCPSSSEHKMCTSACPATCTDLQAPTRCDRPCVEGCECHEGFVFSGGQCVSMADCGCLAEGKYYEKGESFLQQNCLARCQCTGNGTLSCASVEICPEGQVCKVQDGVRGCFPPGTDTCHIFAGSHHITFDGSLYHWVGSCSYRAVETCTKRAEQFSVTINYGHRGRQTPAVLESVTTSYKDLDVTLWRNKTVYVNGTEAATHRPLPLGIAMKEKPPYVAISFSFGLWVKFDGGQNLFIEVDETYKGHLCGLCGQYSGFHLDDFSKSNGALDSDEIRFASSWMVMTEQDWQCDPGLQVPPKCSAASKERHVETCRRISDLSGPFEGCHWKVHPKNYYKSCLLDQCNTAGSTQQCRRSLEAYVAACEHAGIDFPNWWTETLCDPPTQCNFSCSFDTSLCLWMQSVHDNLDWIVFKGSTPSQRTGPSSDHTTGDQHGLPPESISMVLAVNVTAGTWNYWDCQSPEGHYIYIEGDDALEGEVAHLVSPTCTSLGPFCFRFWYHLYGAATLMSLRVYVAPEGQDRRLLWIATGRKGDRWLPASITVPNTGRLQMIVEGMRGEDFLSDAAVDDISMTPGHCMD